MDDFRVLQRQWNYTFHVFRTKGDDQVDLESPECSAYPFPRLSSGIYDGIRRGELRSRFRPYLPIEAEQKARRNQQKPTVTAARRRLRAKLRSRRLCWSMDLGWGGYGLASLFHYKNDSPPYNKTYLVAKCNLEDEVEADEELKNERETTERFKNAMHIVQLGEPPIPVDRRRSERVRQRQGLAVSGDGGWLPHETNVKKIMFLEYCPRGSLHKALCTSVSKDVKFTNRVLWHMFHCLIKACIAMAYPPKHYEEVYDGMQPPFSERAPDDIDEQKERFFHRDIDPQNILVGGNGLGSSHPLVPGLKLCDFGIAGDLTGAVLFDRRYMLHLRSNAKKHYSTPEQFTKEWDYVPPDQTPWLMKDQPRVAGNFSWKTNLFQMGLVMLTLITQHEPAMPPFPQRIYVPPINPADHDDDDAYHPDYTPDEPRSLAGDVSPPPSPPSLRFRYPTDDDIEEDGDRLDEKLFGPGAYRLPNWNNENRNDTADRVDERWMRVWSYGGYVLDESDDALERGPLMRYDHVDRKLRRLVAQCLCADPYYRPRMRWLDDEVGGEIRRRWGGGCGGDEDEGGDGSVSEAVEADMDEGVREWVRELFERPIPVDDTHVSWSGA